MTKTTYACPRCCGTGTIKAHSNVLGGVCFRCHGSGRLEGKPPKATPVWVVRATRIEDGEHIDIYTTKHARPEVVRAEAERRFSKTGVYDVGTIEILPAP